jgi:probable rRNA maturation factor
MNLTIINRSGDRVPRRFIEAWLKALRPLLKKEKLKINSKSEFTILFVNQKEMRELNKTYRGKDYPTDVLSFEGDTKSTFGELVISPQVIKRQAKAHGLTLQDELGYMVLHGVLHLLGFDHENSKREAKRMFTLQDKLFERLCSKF